MVHALRSHSNGLEVLWSFVMQKKSAICSDISCKLAVSWYRFFISCKRLSSVFKSKGRSMLRISIGQDDLIRKIFLDTHIVRRTPFLH
jgi:hypothetical protein